MSVCGGDRPPHRVPGEDENRAAAQAIMLLLLTGGRRREITLAKWEQVDWTRRALLVSLSKSGKPRTIALNTAALTVLKSIPRDPAQPIYLPDAPHRRLQPVGSHPTSRRTRRRPLA
jgi:integrase